MLVVLTAGFRSGLENVFYLDGLDKWSEKASSLFD